MLLGCVWYSFFFLIKQSAIEPNAITVILALEKTLSLRIDEQLRGEAREYLRAGL